MGAGAGQTGGMQQMMPQIGQMAARSPAQPQQQMPMNQIGDMRFMQPATPAQLPGQRLAGQEYAAGFPGVTTEQALEARRPQEIYYPEGRSPVRVEAQRQMPVGGREFEISQRRQAGPTNYGPVPDSMRQMPVGGFAQPDQASMQAQLDALNQARQAGFQVGPTPNQPQNPYASMSEQMQQMQQMQAMQDQGRMQAPQGIAALRPRLTPGQMAQIQGQQQYAAQMQAANAPSMQKPTPLPTAAGGKGTGSDPRMTGGIAGMLTGQRVPTQSVPQSQYYQPMVRRAPGMAITPPQPPAPVRAPVQQRIGGHRSDR